MLPRTTIVSIGHRSTLFAFHDRHLTLLPEGGYHRIRDAVPAKESTKNWRIPEGAGLNSCVAAWRDGVPRGGRRLINLTQAAPSISGEAPCSPLDDDQVLAVALRSCKLEPVSKCSTKIRPMLRVQATAAMDETARPTRPLPGTM